MSKRRAAGRRNTGQAIVKRHHQFQESANTLPAVNQSPGAPGARPAMTVSRGILLRELAVDSISKQWLNGLIPYNPDDLVSRRGLVVYRDMMRRDGVVKNAIETKILARLSTGYSILPPDESVEPRAAELAAFTEYNIEHMRGNFLEALRRVMSALPYGFSVTEENWTIYKRGKWAGYLGLDTLKTKDPRDWDFVTDKYGNLIQLVQGLTTGQQSKLPPEKFIVFSYNGEHGNWYGTSDLRAAYRAYFSKDMVGRYWNVALEKFGMPTVYATLPEMEDQGESEPDGSEQQGGLSQADKDYLLDMLDKIQTASSFYVPEGVKLNLLESGKNGKAGFEAAVKHYDKEIVKAILLPTLTTDEGERGTQALGREHGRVFIYVLNYLGALVEEIINEQLVRRLIDYNFRNVEAYPYFKFNEYGPDRENEYAELLERAANLGALPDATAPWVREKLGFPQVVEDEQQRRAEPAPAPKAEPGPDKGGDQDTGSVSQGDTQDAFSIRDYMLRSVVPFMEAKHSPATDWPRHESLASYVALLEENGGRGRMEGLLAAGPGGRCVCPKCGMKADHETGQPCSEVNCPKCGTPMTRGSTSAGFQEGQGKATAMTPPATDLKVRKLPRPKTEAERKVDFQEIQNWWEALTNVTVDKLEDAMRGVKRAVTKQARRIADSGKPSDIDKLQLPVKEMGNFRKAMEDLYTLDYVKGIQDGSTEVGKALGKKLAGFEDGPYGLHFEIQLDLEHLRFAAPNLDPADAIEYLAAKRPTLRRALRAYLRRAFTVTGVEKERILAEVKYVLETGLARGSSVPSIMGQVDNVFSKYVMTGEIRVDPQTGKTILRTPGRLETIVRTNLAEAYNSGRMALYSDPDVEDVVEALQYSAIIDSRTTEFCRSYDGFTRPPSDPAWQEIVPPNHFNCRSIVVPYVRGEEWKRTETRPAEEPQEGFKL